MGRAVPTDAARRDRWLLLGDDHKSLLKDNFEPHGCRPHQLTPRKIMSTKKPIDPKVLQSLLELQAEMTTGLAGLKEVIAQPPKHRRSRNRNQRQKRVTYQKTNLAPILQRRHHQAIRVLP